MKKLKHTPGPWKGLHGDGVDKRGNVHILSEYGRIAILKKSEKQHANARLIAAAPEMLEAFIKTYKEFERISKHKDTSLKDVVYLNGVLAVLDSYFEKPFEKATGGKIEDLL